MCGEPEQAVRRHVGRRGSDIRRPKEPGRVRDTISEVPILGLTVEAVRQHSAPGKPATNSISGSLNSIAVAHADSLLAFL